MVFIPTIFIAILSIIIGIFISPIPRNLGLYRFIASKYIPALIGFTPIFHHGLEWKYSYKELFESCHQIKGQTAIVTGANSGIGFETSKVLVQCGVHVTMVCRNPTKCTAAANRIRMFLKQNDTHNISDTTPMITTMIADTSSLKSVQTFSKQYLTNYENSTDRSLDILYLNAGIGSRVKKDGFKLSEDGFEMIFATNYIGHHLMYRLLEPLLLKSKMARVVQTSSCASFNSFDRIVPTSLQELNDESYPTMDRRYYGQSKLAQILWTKHLTNLLEQSGYNNVFVNALHPGFVDTGIWNNMERNSAPKIIVQFFRYLRENIMWTAQEGALTQLYLGVSVDKLVEHNVKGKYFHPQCQEVINPLSLNETLQKELWDFSNELIANFL